MALGIGNTFDKTTDEIAISRGSDEGYATPTSVVTDLADEINDVIVKETETNLDGALTNSADNFVTGQVLYDWFDPALAEDSVPSVTVPSGVNTTIYSYTAPATGVYVFAYRGTAAGIPAGNTATSYYYATGPLSITNINDCPNGPGFGGIAGVYKLNAGQVISIGMTQFTGNTVTTGASTFVAYRVNPRV